MEKQKKYLMVQAGNIIQNTLFNIISIIIDIEVCFGRDGIKSNRKTR